jgi:hypothetical protein
MTVLSGQNVMFSRVLALFRNKRSDKIRLLSTVKGKKTIFIYNSDSYVIIFLEGQVLKKYLTS